MEFETKLHSAYSDSKFVFIEIFNRTLLHIISKPRFVKSDDNLVNLITDAHVSQNNNKHSTISLTDVDESKNPATVRYSFSFKNIRHKLKFDYYVRNVDNCNIFDKGYTSNWITK